MLKVDIAAFFASVPHDRLLERVRARARVPEAVAWLEVLVRDGGDRGLPIGALTPQLLASVYLDALDHHVTDDLGFGAYVRYMDDVLVFGSGPPLAALRAHLESWLPETLGLVPHPRHCWQEPTRQPVAFLAARIGRGRVRADPVRLRVAKRRIFRLGREPETHGVAQATAVLAHLRQLDTLEIRRTWFTPKPGGITSGAAGNDPAREPRRHPRLPPRQLGAPPPDGRSSRTPALCRGADPARVPWLVSRRAANPRPGGGLLRGVASGPISEC